MTWVTPAPAPGELRILPVHGIGEIAAGDDLGGIIAEACNAEPSTALADGDVLVVTQKIVSKAENRIEATRRPEGRRSSSANRSASCAAGAT